MANPNFVANYSTNEIFRNEDTNRCLTDDLDTIESDIADLETNKADSDHTHSGYAAADHTHTGFASESHTHSGYAATSHTHSEYAGATHTHDQGDISGLSTALAGKAAASHTHAQTEITGLVDALATKANVADVTAKADLVDGKVPTSQLPAFVDDVLEYANLAAFPTAGESGKIYVAQDTNKTYRWSGSAYVEISSSIALGETAATAYRGDRGATAYTHSQNSDVHVTAAQKTAWDSKAAGDHTHDYAASGHTHTPASIGAAAASHTHNYAASNHTHDYAASSHTHTPASIGAAAASHTHNYAASSHTHDYLPLTGGTVNGDVNVAGVIRGNGQQAYYFAQSTMSQTLGTNNATGGTNIACGADATCNIGGAIQKTASVLPRSTNTYLLGNANFRWKGIYSAAAVNVSSDERMKRDIATMDIEELARFVNFLEVKTFNYKDDAEGADARIGLIAQEVQGVNPDIAKFFVKEGEDGMLGLTPADLVFASIAALQVANKRIEALEHKVATLEAHKCNCK